MSAEEESAPQPRAVAPRASKRQSFISLQAAEAARGSVMSEHGAEMARAGLDELPDGYDAYVEETSGNVVYYNSETGDTLEEDIPAEDADVRPLAVAELSPEERAAYDLERILMVQANYRGRKVRKQLKKKLKMNSHRNKVAREILTTERTYHFGLKTMVDVALKPLQWNAQTSSTPILNEADIAAIFSNAEAICDLADQLLGQLEERLASWTSQSTLGDIFLFMAPFLKIYTAYCNNFEAARALVAEVEKRPIFKKFWAQVSMHPDTVNIGSMASFLIMPVQRIPRYVLLLSDFLKSTWEDHPDYDNIAKALELMRGIGGHVNQAMGTDDASDAMLDAQTQFGAFFDVLTPTRSFVRKGPLTLVNTTTEDQIWGWLFNDLLVVSEKISDTQFTHKAHIDLSAALAQSLDDLQSVQHAFRVSTAGDAFTFTAADEADKASWFADVQAACGDPGFVSVFVVGTAQRTERRKRFTVYVIELTFRGTTRRVFKRYSEFYRLNQDLKRLFPGAALSPLPGKKFFTSMGAKEVEKRIVTLGLYLQHILLNREMAVSEPVVEFIEDDDGLLQSSVEAQRAHELSRAQSVAALEAAGSDNGENNTAGATTDGSFRNHDHEREVRDLDEARGETSDDLFASTEFVRLAVSLIDGAEHSFAVSTLARASVLANRVAREAALPAASWPSFAVFLRGADGQLRALDADEFPVRVLRTAVRDHRQSAGPPPSLLFKKHLFLPSDAMDDPALAYMVQVQAQAQVLSGRIHTGIREQIRLAALQAQACMGPFTNNSLEVFLRQGRFSVAPPSDSVRYGDPKGIITLTGCRAVPDPSNSHSHAVFKITGGAASRDFFMSAESKEERDAWVAAVNGLRETMSGAVGSSGVAEGREDMGRFVDDLIAARDLPHMVGWLEKRGGRVHTWKARYCVLMGGAIVYFKSPPLIAYDERFWRRQLKRAWEELGNMAQLDAQKGYVDVMRAKAAYGATLFPVRCQSNRFPNDVFLGIKHDCIGVYSVHSTAEIERFAYEDVTWSAYPSELRLQPRQEPKPISFQVPNAFEIISAIRAYRSSADGSSG